MRLLCQFLGSVGGDLGYSRIGALYRNDLWGSGNFQVMSAACIARESDVVGFAFKPDDPTSIAAQVEALQDALDRLRVEIQKLRAYPQARPS